MKILAFETASSSCSVALSIDGPNVKNRVQEINKNAPRQQAQLILSMIQTLLHKSALSFDDLDAVAFGCGPGSFTGIRIATCVAQAIGFAKELPIIQISSLAALAQAAYDQFQWTTLLTAVDAHMEHIYFARYQVNKNGLVTLIGEEQKYRISAVEDASVSDWDITKRNDKIDNSVENTAGVGNGWATYGVQLNATGFQPHAINTSVLPTAHGIVKLATQKFMSKEWIGASQVMPAYL